MPPTQRALAAGLAVAAGTCGPARGDVTFFDDGSVALRAILNGGVIEPAIPLYLNAVRVDDPSTPGPDGFRIIDFYDRVPGTGSYPLTFADIIANGYVRPMVQRADGSGSSIGTSVITGPSFRPAGQSLDLIPDMIRADVVTGGPERVAITGQGQYGARALLVCTRGYPDPIVGRSTILVDYVWTATENITLPAAFGVPGGRGFDAFRLVTLSSMLADLGTGAYDGNFLGVTDPLGRTRTIALDNPHAAQYLYPAPQPTGVGRGFELFKDTRATWNPLSPSVRVEIVALSGPAGMAAPLLGVHAWHLGSTNPNDDSLSVWLEWLNAPQVVPAGAQIQVHLRIVATPATDPGDLDHDGAMDCRDIALLDGLIGTPVWAPTFDAYADLDRSGLIDGADRALLLAVAQLHPADFNGDGVLTVADFGAFQTSFVLGEPRADFNGDGVLSVADFGAFQTAFVIGCL